MTIENGYAYVGHIDPPYGTSIVDVHDPKHPKLVSQLEVPEGIRTVRKKWATTFLSLEKGKKQ